jgi:hypothetical protein
LERAAYVGFLIQGDDADGELHKERIADCDSISLCGTTLGNGLVICDW